MARIGLPVEDAVAGKIEQRSLRIAREQPFDRLVEDFGGYLHVLAGQGLDGKVWFAAPAFLQHGLDGDCVIDASDKRVIGIIVDADDERLLHLNASLPAGL